MAAVRVRRKVDRAAVKRGEDLRKLGDELERLESLGALDHHNGGICAFVAASARRRSGHGRRTCVPCRERVSKSKTRWS
jgi:hypothetical protein